MRLPVKFAHLSLQFWMRKRRHFLQYLGILFMKSMVDANIFHLSYINMLKETRNCVDSCRIYPCLWYGEHEDGGVCDKEVLEMLRSVENDETGRD